MFRLFDFYTYDGYDDFSPDRSGWRDKSDAALRRENHATQLFDAFLEKCKAETNFPVTEEIIPAAVHLTSACWSSFRKYVVDQGCTTKRREATHEERTATKNTRSGKMYVISVTVPVHPSVAKSNLQEKKRKAAVAAERKKEKAKIAAEKAKAEAERKAAEMRELRARVKDEYAAVVSMLDEKKENDKPSVGSPHHKKPGPMKRGTKRDNNVEEPSPKRRKTTTTTTITVPRQEILQHAEEVHLVRVNQIANELHNEKAQEHEKLLRELDDKFDAKAKAAKQEARDRCDLIRKTIIELSGK